MKTEDTMDLGLRALRALARGQVHAGYHWMAVMGDGECVCERCVTENYRQIYRATRDKERSGWRVIRLTHSGEAESNEYCAHCNRLYFEVEEPPRYQCYSCGATPSDVAKPLAECDRLAERLDPGATVPAGECACGAFLYLLETGDIEIAGGLQRWNAQPIAAVPDLIVACRAALALLENPDADEFDAQKVEPILLAALRKAGAL